MVDSCNFVRYHILVGTLFNMFFEIICSHKVRSDILEFDFIVLGPKFLVFLELDRRLVGRLLIVGLLQLPPLLDAFILLELGQLLAMDANSYTSKLGGHVFNHGLLALFLYLLVGLAN
jgi:hypothetical protein